jgi:hypothetical protein
MSTPARIRRHHAAAQRFNPGNFKTHDRRLGGGPIVKNKLFAFGAYEKQDDTRPLTTFTSNPAARRSAATRRACWPRISAALSSFLRRDFSYDTGPFDNIRRSRPAKPWMLKGDYNVNNANKVTFRYNQLDSSSPIPRTDRRARHLGRQTGTTNFLSFANSNYAILENLKSASASGTRCSAT